MFHGGGRQSSFHLGTHEVHRINAARLQCMSTPATYWSVNGMFQALWGHVTLTFEPVTVKWNYMICVNCGTSTFKHRQIRELSRSTGTVHTSAKAHLTSAAIWQISMSSRFMSVNHFPYQPTVTNPENNPCIQRENTRLHSIQIVTTFHENFRQIRSEVLHKVANRQTDK